MFKLKVKKSTKKTKINITVLIVITWLVVSCSSTVGSMCICQLTDGGEHACSVLLSIVYLSKSVTPRFITLYSVGARKFIV